MTNMQPVTRVSPDTGSRQFLYAADECNDPAWADPSEIKGASCLMCPDGGPRTWRMLWVEK